MSEDGVDRLVLVDPEASGTTTLDLPYTAISSLTPVGAGVAAVAASFAAEPAIVHLASFLGNAAEEVVVELTDDELGTEPNRARRLW